MVTLECDLGYPLAWRDPRYYPTIKKWARAAEFNKNQVLAFCGSRMFFIAGETEYDLGMTRRTHSIFTDWDENSRRYRVIKTVPRAAPYNAQALPND